MPGRELRRAPLPWVGLEDLGKGIDLVVIDDVIFGEPTRDSRTGWRGFSIRRFGTGRCVASTAQAISERARHTQWLKAQVGIDFGPTTVLAKFFQPWTPRRHIARQCAGREVWRAFFVSRMAGLQRIALMSPYGPDDCFAGLARFEKSKLQFTRLTQVAGQNRSAILRFLPCP